MTLVEGRSNKGLFKIRQLCGIWKIPLCDQWSRSNKSSRRPAFTL